MESKKRAVKIRDYKRALRKSFGKRGNTYELKLLKFSFSFLILVFYCHEYVGVKRQIQK